MTASPRPNEPGRHAPRQPDSTDPDLAPQPAMTETDRLSAFADSDIDDDVDADRFDDGEQPAAGDGVDGDVDDDGDPEPVEDGLLGSGEPGPAAVAARLSRRPRDMVLSIGLLLVVLFALFGMYRCLGGDEGARVDPGPAYAEARAGGAFPVAEPSGLKSGWRAVSAVYQPQTTGAVLRVGWRTPNDGSVQLVEGSLAPDVLLARELGAGARETGRVEINGKSWQAYDAREGERALVLLEPGRTIIIVGRASESELREFAGALK